MDIHKTGVYIILNLVNDKVYIGSAARSFQHRWKGHRVDLRRGKHHNKHLQAAWNEYGEENFIFRILEICDKEDCIEREQYWLDGFDACNREKGYNRTPTAGSPLGIKHTDESKKIFSERNNKLFSNPEYREKHKKAVSESNRRKAKDPVWLANNKARVQKAVKTEKWKTNQKAGCKIRNSNPEYRKKHKEAIQLNAKDPEYRDKLHRAWAKRKAKQREQMLEEYVRMKNSTK